MFKKEKEKGMMEHCTYAIARAYADCNERFDGKRVYEIRQLSYLCRRTFTPMEAKEILKEAIGSYNNFNFDLLDIIQEYLGNDCEVYIARENSVCLYLNPKKGVAVKLLYKLQEKLKAYELSVNELGGWIRALWS